MRHPQLLALDIAERDRLGCTLAHQPVSHQGHKSFNERGVPLRAAIRAQHLQRLYGRPVPAIEPIGRHRIELIDDRADRVRPGG